MADAAPVSALVVPEWMDKVFFKETLGTDIKDARVCPAVATGENYASLVFRAEVDAVDGTCFKLIIKCLPTSEFRAQMVREGEITLREIRMYKETLALLGEPVSRPKCLYACLDEVRDAVVLEDLRPAGFRTRDRHLGLDLPHALLVMEQIGRLHGAGVALRMNEPETFEKEIVVKYPDVMFGAANKDKMTPFSKLTMSALGDAAERHLPMRFRALAPHIRDMGNSSFNALHQLLKLPEDRAERDKLIFTLNHGDTWSNNILFKYNDDQPTECVLIDFQISRAVTPVVDLLYFLSSSTNQELRQESMDDLLNTYYKAAREMLRQRGIPDPGRFYYSSVEDLKAEMQRNGLLGFLLGCFIMPIVIAAADDAPDLDEFNEESLQTMDKSPFAKMYRGPLFCRRFREILEDADDLGVFDDPNTWQRYNDETPAESSVE